MFSFRQIQQLITQRYRNQVFIVLPLMYFVGLIGLHISPVQGFFKFFSSINLWVSLGLILLYQPSINRSFSRFALLTFSAGFLVEVLGVKTSLIFGTYWYGKTLGIQLWDVPIVLGANWLILVYGASILTLRLMPLKTFKSDWAKHVLQSIVATTIMVLLDILIEPVAIYFDFWHWENEIVPLQNYIAWFLVALPLVFYCFRSAFEKMNDMALLIMLLQLFFFVGHTILFHFL